MKFLPFLLCFCIKIYASSWSTPVNLSLEGQNAGFPQIAMEATGNAVVVWQRSDGSNTIIQAARLIDSVWSTADNLSESGQSALFPQVAVDPNENAVAVWQRSNGSNTIIQAATKKLTDDLPWVLYNELSQAGQNATLPQIAVDPNGNAVAVWQRSNGSNIIIQAAIKLTDELAWIRYDALSELHRTAGRPQVAIDANGNAIAVWSRFDGSNSIIQASTKSLLDSSSWSTPVDISQTGQDAARPQIAIAPNGNAVVVWERDSVIQASTKAFTDPSWSTPVNLSDDGATATLPNVAINANGTVVAVWQIDKGIASRITQATTQVFGGSWSTPVDISGEGARLGSPDYAGPQVAINAHRAGVAVWELSSFNSSLEAIQAATLSIFWSMPEDLSIGISPQVAIDANGNAIAVYAESSGSNKIIQATTSGSLSSSYTTYPPSNTLQQCQQENSESQWRIRQ